MTRDADSIAVDLMKTVPGPQVVAEAGIETFTEIW